MVLIQMLFYMFSFEQTVVLLIDKNIIFSMLWTHHLSDKTIKFFLTYFHFLLQDSCHFHLVSSKQITACFTMKYKSTILQPHPNE